MARYNQGFFRPQFPTKYKGDPSNIVYRSGWEFRVMHKFDTHKDIIEWSSEEIVIPYVSPIDGRRHRYFVDFYVKLKNRDGGIDHILIEVKPKAQTRPPIPSTKLNKRYLTEVQTWGVNSAKWEAAREYCDNRGWRFEILTEDHILGNKY